MTQAGNVLFILIDQFRADLLHGALADHVDLPNLRSLMDDAVSFRQHYSVTNPCGPSRASILTGQYMMNHRSVFNGAPLRHDTPNLATEMRKAGYNPMLFGYTDTSLDPRIHHPADPALRSYEQAMPGFDEIVEMRLEESFPWRAHLASKGYDLPDYARFYDPIPGQGEGRRVTDPAFYKAEDSDTAFLTDCCLNHLKVRQDQDWFAHLTYIRPHPPLVAPAPYNRMYDPEKLPLPRQKQPDQPDHPFQSVSERQKSASGFVTGFDDFEESEENIQALRAVYLGLATEVDHHIGRLIRFLQESGQYDDTLIVVGADHGEMLGDFNAWGKMSYFDAAFHVPLIIRDPRNPSRHGTSVNEPTESVDIMPTLLEWVGQTVPTSVNGRSLNPFLAGDIPEKWRQYSYSELSFGDPAEPTLWQDELNLSLREADLAILRKGPLTLVHFSGQLQPVLFDHEAEGELVNLAEEAAHAPALLAMTQTLLSHRMQFADSTLSRTKITDQGPVEGG